MSEEAKNDHAIDVALAFKNGTAGPADASTNGDVIVRLFDILAKVNADLARVTGERAEMVTRWRNEESRRVLDAEKAEDLIARVTGERDAALQNPEGVWRGRWAQEAMNAGELRRELNEVRVNGEVASKHWNSRAELAELALAAEREKNAALTRKAEGYDALLGLAQTFRDYAELPWGGDKAGWGFLFEMFKLIYNEREADRARAKGMEDELENLASDLEECSRLAHICAGEKRMLTSFGKSARRIQAALSPSPEKEEANGR